MRTYDFSPLWRSTVGFDRLFDLAEMAQRAGEDNYPPYNIERLAEDRYQISLAVAGFAPGDIAITAEQIKTAEGDDVARMLNKIRRMTPDEVREMLQRRSGAMKNNPSKTAAF